MKEKDQSKQKKTQEQTKIIRKQEGTTKQKASNWYPEFWDDLAFIKQKEDTEKKKLWKRWTYRNWKYDGIKNTKG